MLSDSEKYYLNQIVKHHGAGAGQAYLGRCAAKTCRTCGYCEHNQEYGWLCVKNGYFDEAEFTSLDGRCDGHKTPEEIEAMKKSRRVAEANRQEEAKAKAKAAKDEQLKLFVKGVNMGLRLSMKPMAKS